jgi:hypothetical protein
MLRLWRSTARRIGSLLAVAVIGASLLASAHHHRAEETRPSDSCALCMVKADSPATTAAPAPQLVPALLGFAIAPTSTVAPGRAYRRFKPSRAPPLHLPIQRA